MAKTVMVQIRNMPDHLHRKLKERAAKAGMSLSEYLLVELRKSAEVPTLEEMMERVAKLPPVNAKVSSAQAVREGRAERDQQIERRLRDRR